MLLRHATPKCNLAGIQTLGLLTSKSQGKRKVVWLHAASKTAWALLHVVRRHGGRVEDVLVLELDVPRKQLRRSKRRVWYSTQDIPPERLGRVLTFECLATPTNDVTE